MKGTARFYLNDNPQREKETNADYIRRILEVAKSDGTTLKFSGIERKYYQLKKQWKTVGESKDKHGKVTHSKHRVEQIRGENSNKGFRRTSYTIDTLNGRRWDRFAEDSYQPPTINKKLLKKCVNSIKFTKPAKRKVSNSDSLLRVIYTDVHIGMETDASGFGLYGGVWNANELMKRKDTIVQKALLNYQGESEIHLIDLGDFMDGWDGQTTRKGHDLPQNMDNVKAFQVGVKFKVELASEIQSLTGAKIKCYNVGNDNHCHEFGVIVNDAAKQILEGKNKNVEYVINRKFIDHYEWNNHCFILCHGKDSKNLKFGFKHMIDDRAKAKIEDYIRINELMYKDNTFEKGDTHLQLFDFDCSEVFNYMNYRALSPASEWVQTNFKRGVSGFTIMRAWKDQKELMTIAYEFGWN
jgi:hypothetical protein